MSPAAAQSCFIGIEAARALADAGVLEGGYWDLDIDLDLDMFDGPIHYDVEFKVGSYECDYDINAVTGKIMSHSIEIAD